MRLDEHIGAFLGVDQAEAKDLAAHALARRIRDLKAETAVALAAARLSDGGCRGHMEAARGYRARCREAMAKLERLTVTGGRRNDGERSRRRAEHVCGD